MFAFFFIKKSITKDMQKQRERKVRRIFASCKVLTGTMFNELLGKRNSELLFVVEPERDLRLAAGRRGRGGGRGVRAPVEGHHHGLARAPQVVLAEDEVGQRGGQTGSLFDYYTYCDLKDNHY